MEYETINTLDRAEALVDVVMSCGFIVRKGQFVRVELRFSRDWPAGGFRTYVNDTWFTNGDAFYDCF